MQSIAVRKAKEFEEVTAVKDARRTEMEGGCIIREHIEEAQERRQPVRVKAPPQNRKR